MIDTARCKPWYRKIHLGLHFAIVKDLLHRHKQNGPSGHLLRSPCVGGEKRDENELEGAGRQLKRLKTAPLTDDPEPTEQRDRQSSVEPLLVSIHTSTHLL